MINDTHDPTLKSWVAAANTEGTDFPIQNLPLGVFCRRAQAHDSPRIGAAIGDQIVDLPRCRELGLFEGLSASVQEAIAAPILNPLMASGAPAASQLREQLVSILRVDAPRADE